MEGKPKAGSLDSKAWFVRRSSKASQSASGLFLGKRESGAQASEDRKMSERRRVKPTPGNHQAKSDREIGPSEPRDLRKVSGKRGIRSNPEEP